MIPIFLADFYKTSHRVQYPEGTEYVYSNWIPRTSRIEGIDKVVVFGLQRFLKKYFQTEFRENFFNMPWDYIQREYEEFMTCTIGPDAADSSHLKELHDLGYLPLEVKAIAEGSKVNIGVPLLTIMNTNPQFFWLTNYVETLISSEIWLPTTAATIANEYREILEKYALDTTGTIEGVEFQGHDFSMRGMAGIEAAQMSGMGHLTSFVGTDTIPAILGHEEYYHANACGHLVGCSIPATEHSVQCVNGVNSIEEETAFAKRLITEIYPSGLVSMVSDTINLWDVLDKVLPAVKDDIMARDGKLVIRPDSGDPVDIICGPSASDYWETTHPSAKKGVIEILWDLFGGAINDEGFKVLDPHIGCIYGDSITLDRAERICKRLMRKGFASTNIVLGIGSFTYQYNTRDTFGFAMKTTAAMVKGVEYQVHKNPVTDNGTKKSLKGFCVVHKDGDDYKVVDKLSYSASTAINPETHDQLRTVFADGSLYNETSLNSIRKRVRE